MTVLAILGVTLAGCSSADTGREGDGYIMYQGPTGRVTVPIEDTGIRQDGLILHNVIVKRLEPPARHHERMMGAGTSGSPAFTYEGEFLGAVSNNVGDRASPYVILTSRKALLRVLENGRKHRPEKPGPQLPPSIYRKLRAGDAVAIAWCWGDLIAKASGIVAVRKGRDVVLFGHSHGQDGERVYGFFRTRPVAVDHGEASGAQIALLTDLIGTAYWDESNGIYGVLGDAPDSIHVRIRYSPFEGPSDTIDFEIARDPRHWWTHLGQCLRSALVSTDLNVSRKRWQGFIKTDGDAHDFDVFAAPFESPLRQIVEAVREKIGDLVPPPRSINLRIFDS